MTPATLTREQFAAAYGMHVNTVDRQRKHGDLRGKWFKIGRKVFMLELDPVKEAQKGAK